LHARNYIFLTGVLVAAMIVVRVLVGGFHEDRLARNYLDDGNIAEAISAFDRSMHWYLPGSPTVARAVTGLEDIAKRAEKQGDNETALRAWRVARSGFYGAKWIVQPGKDIIARCDKNIARLVAEKVAASNLQDPEAGRKAYEKEMAILTKEVGPSVAWSLAALVGFFGWIACAGLFIFKAFGKKREFHRRPALIYGLLFLAAYALWMIALSQA
jgi:hypothetical protein